MALVQTVTVASGLVVEDAYIYVHHVSGTKDTITYGVYIYKNQQAKTAGKASITAETYTFTSEALDTSENIFKQCYLDLKLKPQYADAVDILEDGQSAS